MMNEAETMKKIVCTLSYALRTSFNIKMWNAMVALLGMILGVGILFAGCDKPPETPQDEKTPATKVETEVPAKTETKEPSVMGTPSAEADVPVLSQGLTVIDIASAEDWFAWYELRDEYRKSATSSKQTEQAFENREKELRKATPTKAFNELLELVAFDWRMQSEDPGEGNNATFLASWLFHKKGDINLEPDHQVSLILRGRPDKSHRNYLPREQDRSNSYFELTYALKPSIDVWEKGEYHLFTKRTYRQLPNIPYKMRTFFSEVRKKEDGSWGYVRPYGDRLDMGWYVDLGK